MWLTLSTNKIVKFPSFLFNADFLLVKFPSYLFITDFWLMKFPSFLFNTGFGQAMAEANERRNVVRVQVVPGTRKNSLRYNTECGFIFYKKEMRLVQNFHKITMKLFLNSQKLLEEMFSDWNAWTGKVDATAECQWGMTYSLKQENTITRTNSGNNRGQLRFRNAWIWYGNREWVAKDRRKF